MWEQSELYLKLIVAALMLVAAVAALTGIRRLLAFLGQKVPLLASSRIGNGLKIGLLIIVGIAILNLFNFPLTALIATVGGLCGLVAIGFVAVWSVLCNFLCTLILILFKPFAIGDDLEIPVDNVRGRVVDITMIFTTLAAEDGYQVQIPNNQFFQKTFRRRPGHKTVELSEQLRRSAPADAGASQTPQPPVKEPATAQKTA